MDMRSIIVQTRDGQRVFLPGGTVDRCLRAGNIDAIAARLRALRAGNALVDRAIAELDGADPEADVSVFTISTGRVDSYNSTINPRGWNLEDYDRNPVVLFAHDQASPPVGKDIGHFVDDDRLIGTALFTSRDVNPFGYQVGRMVSAGFLRTASVGFEPIKHEQAKDRESETSPFVPVDIIEQRLVEWSVVPVPANGDCLAHERSGLSSLEVRAALSAMIDREYVSGIARSHIETVRRQFGADPVIVPVGAPMKEAPKPVDLEQRSTPGHEDIEPEVEETPANPLDDGSRAPAMLVCPSCGHEGEAASFAPASAEGEPEADLDNEELAYSEEDVMRIASEIATRAESDIEAAVEAAVEATVTEFKKLLGRLD